MKAVRARFETVQNEIILILIFYHTRKAENYLNFTLKGKNQMFLLRKAE